MNKHLLLGSALLAAISAYPQNGKLVMPSGFAEVKSKNFDLVENQNQSVSFTNAPVKNIKHKAFQASKVTATANYLTGSMNVFSYLVSQSKSLCYKPAINTVSFIHRKSATYAVSSNGNSGSIVAMLSHDGGNTWDSTAIWASASNLGRYPQGGVYNPAGNTNKNNAYVVGMGPITGGSGWLGNWYASKSLNGAGNNTPGPDQQAHLSASPTIKKHEFSRYSFSTIDGGLVRSMAAIQNDPNSSTNLAYGLRGAAMVKGQFTAGAFVWSVDSFIPATNLRSDGSKLIDGTPLQAWSEDGTIGYVVILGSRATETISATRVNSKGGYQPIVYKTTNSGSTWSMLPSNDFADPGQFRGLYDRMYPIVTNSNVLVANFQNNEGNDVTVDANGQLHFVTTLTGHYSNHIDSLGYRYVFGSQQYSYASGNFNWPIIYDFYTNPWGGWGYHMVDSMYSEGPAGTSGQPGFASNPWVNGADKIAYDARIQVSRTEDGRKILYSWSESDTSLGGTKWNIYPDILMKGFDVTTWKVTPQALNVTGGVTIVDQNSFFHYMSDKAIGSSTACIEVPFVAVTSTNGNDGLQPVKDYYLKGAQLCPSSFSVNPLSPTGIAQTANNTPGFEVFNYPNPANGATTIIVGLKDAKSIEIAIYNSVGQLIDTYRLNGQIGGNEVHVDLSNFASGVYVYNVKVGSTSVTKKLIVE